MPFTTTSVGGDGSGLPGPQGPQGEPGEDASGGIVYLGNYVLGNGYIADIAVVRGSDNNLYIAKSSGGLHDPVNNTAEWDIFSDNTAGSADIADFVFTNDENETGRSIISLPGDKGMTIAAGAESDLYLTAGDDLYIQTLDYGDDIFIQAADDVRFTAGRENILNEAENGRSYGWTMNSEGEFHLPGNGYISNPNATVVTPGNRTVTYTDNYLNNQSGLNQANSVALPVDLDTTWFVDNVYSGIFTSPAVISFADGDSTTAVAIFDATSQGTPAVIFQWNDLDRQKTFEQTFPLSVSADYTTTTYDGTPTIVLDPADNNDDQVLVIEATAPNHIHLRAGGAIDQSTAELIIGGEINHVAISDLNKSVAISTAATTENIYVNAHEANNADLMVPETSDILIGDNIVIAGINHPVTYFSPDPMNTGFSIVRATGVTFVAGGSYTFVREEPYENSWHFGSDGVLSGPAMGVVKVPGIMNAGVGSDLFIASNDANIQMLATNHVRLDASNGNVYLNPSGGIYLGTSEVAENEIATLGDIGQAIETGPAEVSFTVNGGTLGIQPTFAGAPIFSGSYIKHGSLVHFQIQVDMDNITSFGTGQYYVDLPFPAKYGYKFREGCLHDISTGRDYEIGGHVFAGQSQLTLTSTDTQSGTVFDIPFVYNNPTILANADNFHISGTYIMQEGV